MSAFWGKLDMAEVGRMSPFDEAVIRHFSASTYPRSIFCIYIVAASLIEGVVYSDVG